MRVVWEKKEIPTAWQKPEGSSFTRKRIHQKLASSTRSAFLTSKIFFSMVAHRLVAYLQRNKLIDTSIQKAGISGFSGCVEHASIIWLQIQVAKKKGSHLHVVFLDLANVWFSSTQPLVARVFFRVPAALTNLVKAYFQDIHLCLTIAQYTTA